MNKQSKGFVLILTLIINVVLLVLILGNAKSLLLNAQLLNLYQKQSNEYYKAERLATKVSHILKLNQPISCLYPNASPNYYFSLFGSMKAAWCHVTIKKHLLYYLVEGMTADCCERSSINKQYSINRYRLNIRAGTISTQRVILFSSTEKACECEAPFVITDGLQSYRRSEV